MALTIPNSELPFDNVIANNPIPVAIQVYDTAHIYVSYGLSRRPASQGADFTVELNEAGSFLNCTVTPTTALLLSINAMISGTAGEINRIYVTRTLPGTNDFVETDGFIRRKIVNEIDMVLMRIQEFNREIGETNALVATFTAQIAALNASVAAAVALIASLSIGTNVNFFYTRGAAILATINPTLPAIYVAGYTTPGVGGAWYKRVAVAPAHAGKFQSADGAWWEMSELFPNVYMFGAVGDFTTDDTAALNNQATYNPLIRLGRGNFGTTAPINLSGAGCGIIGETPGSSIITNKTNNFSTIIVAASVQPRFENFKITRTVTPLGNASGIDLHLGTAGQGSLQDVLIDNNWVGLHLGPTDSGRITRVTCQNNYSYGILMAPDSGNGTMQWQLDDVLSVQNAQSGIGLIGVNGTPQITMGEWRSVQTFANTRYGIAVTGTPTCPVQALRMRDMFIGADGEGGIYLDTYNGIAFEHIIEAPFIEAEGSGPTGPHLATAASNIGIGIVISVNNKRVSVSNGVIINNAEDGINSACTLLKVSNCSISNNGLNLASAQRRGIFVASGRAIITECTIGDNVPALSQLYGIALGAATDYVRITDNDLRNNTTAAILNGSTGTHNTIEDNIDWNPRGTAVVPITASPITYTAGPQEETLYIYNDNTAFVKLLPSGFLVEGPTAIRLKANRTVEITYANVPVIVVDKH